MILSEDIIYFNRDWPCIPECAVVLWSQEGVKFLNQEGTDVSCLQERISGSVGNNTNFPLHFTINREL